MRMNVRIVGDIAVIEDESILIRDARSALDLIASIGYTYNVTKIAVFKAAVAEDFFRLSTGTAGDIVQKFVNYGFRFAVIGDFSEYTSKPLRDFMIESNRGKHLHFAATEADALRALNNP